MNLYAAILCGGRGERFWPKSRRLRPKQFIRLFGSRSLTEQTGRRILPLCPLERQLFVVPAELVRRVNEISVPKRNIVTEPFGRNTAPAVGLAAMHLFRRDPGATMIVLPADHVVRDRRRFLAAVRLAAEVAQDGRLVTFGIKPTRPETNYGYLRIGKPIAARGSVAVSEVLEFREKPDLATATRYVTAGDFLWNSGMFVWRVSDILAALQRFMPSFYSRLVEYAQHAGRRRERELLARIYRDVPSISIDYAVMEKAPNVAAVQGQFDWDDVGAWSALERHLPSDQHGNVAGANCVLRGCEDCVVQSDQGLVAVLGCSDLVVVRDGDAVLVARKEAIGDMRGLLADIRRRPCAARYL